MIAKVRREAMALPSSDMGLTGEKSADYTPFPALWHYAAAGWQAIHL